MGAGRMRVTHNTSQPLTRGKGFSKRRGPGTQPPGGPGGAPSGAAEESSDCDLTELLGLQVHPGVHEQVAEGKSLLVTARQLRGSRQLL